ncbi:hypothetical protein IFM89_036752, partial [Coptis chinensis]
NCVAGKASDWRDFVGIITLLVINSTISFIEENNVGNAAAALMAASSPLRLSVLQKITLGNTPLKADHEVVSTGPTPEWDEGFAWALDSPPKSQKLHITLGTSPPNWFPSPSSTVCRGAITKRMIAIEEMAGMDVLCKVINSNFDPNKLSMKRLFLTGESLPQNKGPGDGVYSGRRAIIVQGDVPQALMNRKLMRRYRKIENGNYFKTNALDEINRPSWKEMERLSLMNDIDRASKIGRSRL